MQVVKEMSETMTENGLREIVRKAAGGDRDAMKTLMRGITSDMYFVTRLFIADRNTARASEETALRSALGRLKEDEAQESFEQWISKIVRDEAVRRILPLDADAIEDLPYSELDEYGSPENIIAYTEEECRVRILHALDALEPAERAAAALHFYEHLTPGEASEYLGITSDQYKSLLSSAKNKFRDGDIDLHTFAALTDRVNPAPAAAEPEPEVTDEPLFDLEIPEEPEFRNEADFDTMELEAQKDDAPIFTDPALQAEEPKLLQDTSVYEKSRIAEEEKPPVKEPEPVQIVDDDAYEDEDDDEDEGGGSAFLKILLALLIMAAVCGGVYWWLFMRNANPAPKDDTTPSSEVTPAEDDKPADEGSVTPAPEPAPEPAPPAFDPNAIIGTAHINVAGIPIHSEANEASAVSGEVVAGADYAVYEVRQDGTDIWYRLDENEWIDTEEGWVTYTEGYNG